MPSDGRCDVGQSDWLTSATTTARIIDYQQTDRADGCSFTLMVGVAVENGVESVWHYNGHIHYHVWGFTDVSEVRIKSGSPQLTLRKSPVKIERTLTAGEKHGDRYETKVDIVMHFVDGTTRSLSHVVGYEHDVSDSMRKTASERREAIVSIFQNGMVPTGPFAKGKLILTPITRFEES